MRNTSNEQYILKARTQYLTYNTLTDAFTVGDTITGTSSGKTAVVLADDGVSVLTVGSVSGAFTADEAITGALSGAAKYESITNLTGNALQVEDWKFILLTLSSEDNADFTIQFQGSMSDECPDFSAGRSVTNRWEYIQVKDMQSGSAVDGDTGVTWTADDVVRYETIFSGYKWVCATLTTYNAGLITLTAKMCDNK